MPGRQRKVRHQQKIDSVSRQNGDQRIDEIAHSCFRHRESLCLIQLFTAPANILQMLEPSTSVQYVKGIGPRLAEVLGAKGIHSVDDLLHYLPFATKTA